jgi:hypothetical protein
MQFFAIPQGAMPIGSITSDKMGNIWFMVGTNGGEGFGEFMPISGTFAFFQPGMKSSPPPPTSGSTKAGAAATGTTLSATAGVNFMTAVAAFIPQTPIASPGQAYQATIDWGDGTNSSLVLTIIDNATYDVTAGHTYHTAGTYSIKVTIGNYNPANPLGDDAVTVFSTANVDPFNFTM